MSAKRVLEATQLVGGAQTAINYILNPSPHKNTAGWATFDDGNTASPVDGTSGTVTTTLTRSTSSPLRGDASFLLTTTAANLRGEGASYDFSIDSADKAKVLSISFDYAFDVTQATGDWSVWIYDVTNATLIQPAGYQVPGGVSGINYKFQATWQSASNSTSYRLIIHRSVETATAVNFKFDNVVVGPEARVYGPPITDWVSYTPTVAGWTTNLTSTAKWRRVGDTMEVQFKLTATGALSGTLTDIGLPSGHSIDTTKFEGNTQAYFNSLGTGYYLTNTQLKAGLLTVSYGSTTAVRVAVPITSTPYIEESAVSSTVPGTFAANDYIQGIFKVPILGWSSSLELSSSTDTRVVAARATNTAGTSLPDTTVIPWPTVGFDTHGTMNGTTGVYTIAVPGKYKIHASINMAAYAPSVTQTMFLSIVKGASTVVSRGPRIYGNGNSVNWGLTVSDIIDLVAGDTIKIVANNNITGSLETTAEANKLVIERLSGPSVIAASETVAVHATLTSSLSSGTGLQDLICNSDTSTARKERDTHGAYDTSTGIFTAPISGMYLFSSYVGFVAFSATTPRLLITDQSNNVIKYLDSRIGTSNAYLSGSVQFYLNAGQQYKFRVDRGSVSSQIFGDTSGADTSISIVKVGN